MQGYLFSEQTQWNRFYFRVSQSILIQYANETSTQAICGLRLDNARAQLLPPTYSPGHPNAFSITCASGLVVFSADDEASARKWVDSINGPAVPVGSLAPLAPVQPQPQLSVVAPQPNVSQQVLSPGSNTSLNAVQNAEPSSPSGKIPINAGPAPQPSTPSAPATDQELEAFWSKVCKPDGQSALWDTVQTALVQQNCCDTSCVPAVYALANIFSGKILSTTRGASISRTDFGVFVHMLGPLSQLGVRCRDLASAGYFHGELTSAESDAALKTVGKPGCFLARLRKGMRHNAALAFIDAQGACKHILLDVSADHTYCIHALHQAFPSLPALVAAYPGKFVRPVPFDVIGAYGPPLSPLTSPVTSPTSKNPPLNPMSPPALSPLMPTTPSPAKPAVPSVVVPTQTPAAGPGIPTVPSVPSEANPGEDGRSRARSETDMLVGRLQANLAFAREQAAVLEAAQRPYVPSVLPPGAQTATGRWGASLGQKVQTASAAVEKPLLLTLSIPAADKETKIRSMPSTTVKEVLAKLVPRLQLPNSGSLRLYDPGTGLWLDGDRPLCAYLFAEEAELLAAMPPQEQNPCAVNVRNTLSGSSVNVPIDARTKVRALALAVPDVPPPPASTLTGCGIRVRTARGSFFCDPDELCASYGIGLDVHEVELARPGSTELFLSPADAPLSFVKDLNVARASEAATPQGINRLIEQLNAAKQQASREHELHQQQKLASIRQQQQPQKPQQPPQQQPAKPPQKPPSFKAPATPDAKKPEVMMAGKPIDLPPNIEVTPAIAADTAWLCDLAYLVEWWTHLSPEGRKQPSVRANASKLVKKTFGEAATPERKAIAEKLLSPEQLAAAAKVLAEIGASV